MQQKPTDAPYAHVAICRAKFVAAGAEALD
jgi:hypothetical protein